MTTFDHEIVDIEKAGSRFVIGIVKNADGPRDIIAIDTDSRESRAGRIVEGDYDLGQIGDDFRLRLTGLSFRRLKFESGPDSGSATFKGHRAAGADELHAFGYLDWGGDDVGILLGACKFDGGTFWARCI